MSEYRRIRVADAGAHVGEPVEIAGWLYNLRKSGKIIFPLVRDGSGILQGVALKSSVAPEVFEMLKDLTQESSLMIRGRLRAEERGLARTAAAVSTPAFGAVWANPEDDAYDAL